MKDILKIECKVTYKDQEWVCSDFVNLQTKEDLKDQLNIIPFVNVEDNYIEVRRAYDSCVVRIIESITGSIRFKLHEYLKKIFNEYERPYN